MDEKRWLLSVYYALAVENAVEGFNKFKFSKEDPEFVQSDYDDLMTRVKGKAERFYKHYDRGLFGEEFTDYTLAREAFSLVFVQSCQTFELGRWGKTLPSGQRKTVLLNMQTETKEKFLNGTKVYQTSVILQWLAIFQLP